MPFLARKSEKRLLRKVYMEEKYIVEKGTSDIFDEYIDLINYSFGFNGRDSSFPKLLPKLFGKGSSASEHTHFVKDADSGKLLACVGSFPIDFNICGEKVKAFGIGNVAVHPRYRGKGYMKAAMAAAFNEMREEGADMALLSGRRHRYNYFGFEKCGTDSVYTLTKKTVSYVNPDLHTDLQMKIISKEDSDTLDAILALHNTRNYRAERSREKLYDILVSWEATPYAFYKQNEFAGWAVVKGNTVTELVPADIDFVPDMVTALSTLNFEMRYLIPEFERPVGDAMLKYAETVYTGADLCFSIFNYEKMISLLLKLKAAETDLIDGQIAVKINGFFGEESLLISVKSGVPNVRKTDNKPDITLEHLEAMQFFFFEKTPLRNSVPTTPRSWFPLCIYVHSPDNV